MTDAKIRNLLLQAQPEVYRAGGDVSARTQLQEATQADPHAVLAVLLEDLIWRVALEQMVQGDPTPALGQILELARKGDFDLAHERTQLAFHLERDRALLVDALRSAANNALTDGS